MITPYPHETDTYLAAVAAHVQRRHQAEELADVGVELARQHLAADEPQAALRVLCDTAVEVLREMTP